MGIDPVHIINHDLYFEHTDVFLKQLEEKTGLPAISISFGEELSEGFKGWYFHHEHFANLQDYFRNGKMLEAYLHGVRQDEFSMYVSPYLFEIANDDFYMGRWSSVKWLADWIKDNGIPPPEYYSDNDKEALWIMQSRKRLYEYGQAFGTKQMITFCDDMHGDWLDWFSEDRWTFDQFNEWGKKEFIYVKFQDLVHFDFPESKPDYYNVFIYDDFADLQQEHIKWQQPYIELYFSCPLKEYVTNEQATAWIHYLIEEALKLKLSVHAALSNRVIEGQVFFMQRDFPLYLTRHFIESFFYSRGMKVHIHY